jgi:hypothetical protein
MWIVSAAKQLPDKATNSTESTPQTALGKTDASVERVGFIMSTFLT